MNLLQSGVDINVIRGWLGHVSLNTTHRYAEIDLDMKREALKSCQIGHERAAAPRWENKPDIIAWLESI